MVMGLVAFGTSRTNWLQAPGIVLAPKLSLPSTGAKVKVAVVKSPGPRHGALTDTYRGYSLMTADQFKADMIALLPRLRRFALSLTRSGPDADDLLQEACTKALQSWHNYDPAQPLDRWMFRVVRNSWTSEIRKRQVRQGEGQVDAETADELIVQTDPEAALTLQQVQARIAQLDPELAQPLLLVSAEGYSYREAADLLDVPVGTIMSRIHRARKQLSAELSDQKGTGK